MTKEQIEQYLMENCNVSAPEGAVAGTGIKEIGSSIFKNGKQKNIPKAEVAKALAQWYADKQNTVAICNGGSAGLHNFDGLNEIEGAFISPYVQYGGKEFIPATKAIAEKYGITPPENNEDYSWSRHGFYDTSKMICCCRS